MIVKEDIDNALGEMRKYQLLADEPLAKKRAVDSNLSKLGDAIAMYCADLFNEEYEDKIDARGCKLACSHNVNVNFPAGKVFVSTDDPVSNHPYDSTEMEFDLVQLLEHSNLQVKIKAMELI